MDNKEFNDIFGEIFGGAFGYNPFNYNPEDDESCLDRYWREGNIEKYYAKVNQLKHNGYRILRNSEGLHKIQKR